MSASKTYANCPVCLGRFLDDHCDSRMCGWHKCRNKTCKATIDLRRRRGFAPDKNEPSGFRQIVLAS